MAKPAGIGEQRVISGINGRTVTEQRMHTRGAESGELLKCAEARRDGARRAAGDVTVDTAGEPAPPVASEMRLCPGLKNGPEMSGCKVVAERSRFSPAMVLPTLTCAVPPA